MAKRSFLIVTTSFAPENAIGAVRMTNIAKYLVRRGHEVSVLAPEIGPSTQIDPTLACDEVDSVDRMFVKHSRVFKRILLRQRNRVLAGRSGASVVFGDKRNGLVGGARRRAAAVAHFLYTMLRNLDWKRSALQELKRCAPGRAFDFMISSYPSVGAMWTARELRRGGVSRVWMADFRDPMNYESEVPFIERWNCAIQQRIVHEADLVSVISNGIVQRFPSEHQSKIKVFHNGFDPDDSDLTPEGILPTNELRLSYTGSLNGGKRDLSVLFQIISELIDRNEVPADGIRFIYAGKDIAILRSQYSGSGLDRIVVDRGSVNRQEAIRIQEDSDLAVVATWNTDRDQGILTGKLFECFLTRTPIIGIVNGTRPDSELKEIVDKVDGGFVFEEAGEEKDGLRDFILSKYNEKCGNVERSKHYNSFADGFAYPNIVEGIESALLEHV